MTDRISKVQRSLDLVAYLVGRRLPVPVDDLRNGVQPGTRRRRRVHLSAFPVGRG